MITRAPRVAYDRPGPRAEPKILPELALGTFPELVLQLLSLLRRTFGVVGVACRATIGRCCRAWSSSRASPSEPLRVA
jgi:hypothetical protein